MFMLNRNALGVSLILFLVFGFSLFADVPHPDLLRKIKSGEVPEPYYLRNKAELNRLGINNPQPGNYLRLRSNTRTDLKMIAILMDFDDKEALTPAVFFDSLLFGNSMGNMNDFYQEVSYGNLTLISLNVPSALGWTRAEHTLNWYANGQNGMGGYPQNCQRLAEEAVQAVDAFVDFSEYDNDGDGYVDALFIIHAGKGAENSGSDSDIWSHAWSMHTPQQLDGVIASRYSTEPEFWMGTGDMTCGMYAHEMGHAVFGLPDQYDYDYDSNGLGTWSLMAGGSWNGNNGNRPAHPDAWSRYKMGVCDPQVITQNTGAVTIPPVEGTPITYLLWNQGNYNNEYFLVENRQQTGYDIGIPASGMLIYHVDESQNNNDHQWYPGLPASEHYRVALEQADGRWDMEHNSNSGDFADAYPGSTQNHNFALETTPDSKSYANANTWVGVLNISDTNGVIQADFQVNNPINQPNIVVNPAIIDTTIGLGQNHTLSVMIQNTGNLDLAWEIVGNLPSWLTTQTTSGVMNGQDAQEIFFQINPQNLTYGKYETQINIESNSTFNSDLILNLTIHLDMFEKVLTSEITNDIDPRHNTIWGDYDKDGLLDAYILTGGNQPNQLFHNTGNFNLTKIMYGNLATEINNSWDGSWLDLNADGNLDLYLSGGNSNANALYLSTGNNNFTRTLIPNLTENFGDSRSISWGDYNLDGKLDLAVVNASNQSNRLLKNTSQNNNLSFEQVEFFPNDAFYSMDCLWMNLNNDNYPDLYVTNKDDQNNNVYLNNGDGTFQSSTNTILNDQPHNSYSVLSDDFDNDGNMDLFVCNGIVENESFYFGEGNFNFTDLLNQPPVESGGFSLKAASGDIDNDGDLDLVVANIGNQKNFLFLNEGNRQFTRITGTNLTELQASTFDCDLIDLNRDGSLDLLTTCYSQKAHLYKNRGNANNWMEMLFTDFTTRNIVGAKVIASAVVNGTRTWQTRQVKPDYGYFVHFGVGNATLIDTVTVIYPDGFTQQYTNVAVNRNYNEYLSDDDNINQTVKPAMTLSQNYPNPFNPETTIAFTIPKEGNVELAIFNIKGQKVRTLLNETKIKGSHTVTWNGKDLQNKTVASGIYFYKLTSGEKTQVRKMIMVK